ncbi:hypothetical protein IFU08_14565 [Microbacterium sp. CFBP 8790]|uniref:hypothetical protein n=1 Tax=unclassified Microbacterium TaxID=2609290 RepID=UPI001786BC8C|nr:MULTISPECIES: hypothetical protein [unclassified Microbacterium]MBD8207876.1 hypothetical protein [Microbacterium sp. CFBP 8801]MBD8510778.1 hypothetical protein [Microbacterium sp. CFBP 8790]
MPTADKWVLSRFKELHEDVVTDAEADGDHVRLTRKSLPPTRFGILKSQDVAASDVEALLDGDVDFIVNIPKAGIFQGEAIDLMKKHGVPWGGLADGIRAARFANPRGYVPFPYEFVMKGLTRHSRVESVAYVDSRRLRVRRAGGLPDLVLYIEETYQAEVVTVNFALDRCSPFDVFVATNPNAGPTDNAKEAAKLAEVEILRWGSTLARLNHP